ncbi:SpoIIE family protein phosphatase [Streptomyces sp. NPDC056821]|uniref:SpoIIE family protein phosphatase n=1 Tax=unclassified Streptomyces TaxID=2593676 RepID=UPI003686C48B
MQSAAPGPASGWEDLATLVRRLMQDAGASGGMLFLLPPRERALQLSMVYGTSWHIVAPWARIRVEEAVPVAEATRERRLVWVGSPEELALHYPRLALVVPDHAVAAAPIIASGAVRGTVCLLWPSWHPTSLDRGEREAIDTFCHQAGLVLKRAVAGGHPLLPEGRPRVLEPVCSHTLGQGEARAAYDFAARLPGALSLDLEGRITFLNDAAADLLGVRAADLLGARPWERLQWLGDPTFEDRFRAAVISRRPAHFTAVRPLDRRLSFQLYPDASGVSIHIVPLPHAPPAEPERPNPSPAEQTGATTLYHLMHLAASLTEMVRMEDVADRIADQLVPAFGVSGLALMTADDGRLRVVGHRGYPPAFMARFDGESLSSSAPPARALTMQRPLFFASFDEFKHAYPIVVRYGGRNAWAFLPLVIRGRPVGLLVLSYSEARRFPPTERNLLISVAGLIAQALDRARLYDAKHNLARTLQNGLLPRRLPAIPGLHVAARYLPAGRGMDIGGDFYDLIRCDATSAAAAIGDVQGHNVQAAALMGQLRTAVHAHAAAGAPPSELLARTNRLMCDLNPGLFASCLYVHLDLTQHRARLATAGHPPPLLRRPDGRTEILQVPPGLLLGITPDADYAGVEIPLPPGTTLVLYTDGLVEAPGIDIDHAIAELAHQLAQAGDDDMDTLTDTLLQYASHGIPRSDDIAMLLIHRTEPFA